MTMQSIQAGAQNPPTPECNVASFHYSKSTIQPLKTARTTTQRAPPATTGQLSGTVVRVTHGFPPSPGCHGNQERRRELSAKTREREGQRERERESERERERERERAIGLLPLNRNRTKENNTHFQPSKPTTSQSNAVLETMNQGHTTATLRKTSAQLQSQTPWARGFRIAQRSRLTTELTDRTMRARERWGERERE
jgi:hypothetical protein